MQTKLIKSESKLITLETDFKDMKNEYETKITILESTIVAKDVHIKHLVLHENRVACTFSLQL